MLLRYHGNGVFIRHSYRCHMLLRYHGNGVFIRHPYRSHMLLRYHGNGVFIRRSYNCHVSLRYHGSGVSIRHSYRCHVLLCHHGNGAFTCLCATYRHIYEEGRRPRALLKIYLHSKMDATRQIILMVRFLFAKKVNV